MKEERKNFIDVDEVPQDKLDETCGGGNSTADHDGKNLWWLAALLIGAGVAIAVITVLI
jgi:hypothetical protein